MDKWQSSANYGRLELRKGLKEGAYERCPATTT